MPHQNNRDEIPDGWLDDQNVGQRIPGTRFISFKVPLKNALSHSLTESQVFGPWELMDTLAEQEEELGLIIDLTNTTRYSDIEEIPESLLYLQIKTEGHKFLPSNPIILNFKQAVNNFLQNNKDNDKLIGVHCTRGLNRTGYLVCRYLIDVEEVEPKKAIELFNSARGHEIERANYLQDLKSGPRRSNTGMMTCALEVRRGRAACRPPAPRAEHPPRTATPAPRM